MRLYSKMNTLIRLNKYNITLLFVLWTACAHLSAQDNTFNIAAIRVEGPVTTDKAMIVALSGLSVGQTINIPGQEVTQAIKLLWKQGLFSNIDIQAERYQGRNVFLLIKLEEKPRITKYKISGVKKGDNFSQQRVQLPQGTSEIFSSVLTEVILIFFISK